MTLAELEAFLKEKTGGEWWIDPFPFVTVGHSRLRHVYKSGQLISSKAGIVIERDDSSVFIPFNEFKHLAGAISREDE